MKASSEAVKATPDLSWLQELTPAAPGRIQLLGTRDQDNPTARAAFALGRQRGYEAGLKTGQLQGFEEGAKVKKQRESDEASEVAMRLHEVLVRFQDQMASLESQVASDLVSLSIDIARQVLRRELALDKNSLIPVATEALRALGEGLSHIELRVNPVDAQRLGEHLEHQPNGARCHLVPDPGIAPGGLRLEADSGVVDATFEARWQAVMANLGRDEEPLP